MTILLIIGALIWIAAMIFVLFKRPSGDPIGPGCVMMETEQTRQDAPEF